MPASPCVAIAADACMRAAARRAIGALLLAALAIKVAERNALGRGAAPSRRLGHRHRAVRPRQRPRRRPAVRAARRTIARFAAARRRSVVAAPGGSPRIVAMTERKTPSRHARRRRPRPLLLSLGPEPGRGQGGAAGDPGALAGGAALGRRGGAGLALGALRAASPCSRATARSPAACSPARCSPPSSSASSSACSSRPPRGWSSSSTSRRSSSPSACR